VLTQLFATQASPGWHIALETHAAPAPPPLFGTQTVVPSSVATQPHPPGQTGQQTVTVPVNSQAPLQQSPPVPQAALAAPLQIPPQQVCAPVQGGVHAGAAVVVVVVVGPDVQGAWQAVVLSQQRAETQT